MEGDTFLRNVGSNQSHKVLHPRRRYSSGWTFSGKLSQARELPADDRGIFFVSTSCTRLKHLFSKYYHVSGVRVTNYSGSRSDDWICWPVFVQSLFFTSHTALSLIYTLPVHRCTHTLGLSISTSRILATDLNTGTIASNHYEGFLSFLLRSLWNADPVFQFPRKKKTWNSIRYLQNLYMRETSTDTRLGCRLQRMNFCTKDLIIVCVSVQFFVTGSDKRRSSIWLWMWTNGN
jgi:hypothetical protein